MLQPDFDVAVTLPGKQTDAANQRIYLPSIEPMQHNHFNSENTFASAPSLGYIKSRNQVAGSQPHGLSFIQRLSTLKRRPWYNRAKELWAVRRMELVSLVKGETPGVYVSRNVPRMKGPPAERLRNAVAEKTDRWRRRRGVGKPQSNSDARLTAGHEGVPAVSQRGARSLAGSVQLRVAARPADRSQRGSGTC